jgi:hypothetical protein
MEVAAKSAIPRASDLMGFFIWLLCLMSALVWGAFNKPHTKVQLGARKIFEKNAYAKKAVVSGGLERLQAVGKVCAGGSWRVGVAATGDGTMWAGRPRSLTALRA